MILAGVLTVQAKDNGENQSSTYTYLTFETTDGEKISVPASSLSLTISGTTLTAGSQSFTLSNLSKMYFSNADETTGISEALKVDSEEFASATFYDLQGHKVSKEQMRRGVYIVKTNSRTYKIMVK